VGFDCVGTVASKVVSIVAEVVVPLEVVVFFAVLVSGLSVVVVV